MNDDKLVVMYVILEVGRRAKDDHTPCRGCPKTTQRTSQLCNNGISRDAAGLYIVINITSMKSCHHCFTFELFTGEMRFLQEDRKKDEYSTWVAQEITAVSHKYLMHHQDGSFNGHGRRVRSW